MAREGGLFRLAVCWQMGASILIDRLDGPYQWTLTTASWLSVDADHCELAALEVAHRQAARARRLPVNPRNDDYRTFRLMRVGTERPHSAASRLVLPGRFGAAPCLRRR